MASHDSLHCTAFITDLISSGNSTEYYELLTDCLIDPKKFGGYTGLSARFKQYLGNNWSLSFIQCFVFCFRVHAQIKATHINFLKIRAKLLFIPAEEGLGNS